MTVQEEFKEIFEEMAQLEKEHKRIIIRINELRAKAKALKEKIKDELP